MSLTKRLLFITPGFAINENDDFTIPALQEYVQGIGNYRPNWEVVIFALDFPYTNQSYTYRGFTVYNFNGQNKFWRKKRINKKALELAYELHQKKPFYAVHSFWLTQPFQLGEMVAKKLHIHLIATAMGQEVLTKTRYNRAFGKRTKFVFVSQFQRQKSVLIEPKGSTVINWGLSPKSSEIGNKTIDVIGVGNLTDIKNFELFIQVIKILKDQNQEVKATIVGYGPNEGKLKKQVEENHLTQNIQFAGKQSREQTLKLMASAKCLVHTAHYESFGMVIIEAMAMGCAVVCTPVGIAPEVAKCGSNATELAALVQSALQYQAQNALRQFPIEDTIEAYGKVYGFNREINSTSSPKTQP